MIIHNVVAIRNRLQRGNHLFIVARVCDRGLHTSGKNKIPRNHTIRHLETSNTILAVMRRRDSLHLFKMCIIGALAVTRHDDKEQNHTARLIASPHHPSAHTPLYRRQTLGEVSESRANPASTQNREEDKECEIPEPCGQALPLW